MTVDTGTHPNSTGILHQGSRPNSVKTIIVTLMIGINIPIIGINL